MTFDSYKGNDAEKAAVLRFAGDQDAKVLIINGDTNFGKTHLAVALQKHFIEGKKSAEFVTPEILKSLFIEMLPTKDNYIEAQGRYNKLKSCNLLVIDDLGAVEGATENFLESLRELIERHVEFGKLVVTTNLRVTDVEGFGGVPSAGRDGYLNSRLNERVMSRLYRYGIRVVTIMQDGRAQ